MLPLQVATTGACQKCIIGSEASDAARADVAGIDGLGFNQTGLMHPTSDGEVSWS